jgi:hypothetical protein
MLVDRTWRNRAPLRFVIFILSTRIFPLLGTSNPPSMMINPDQSIILKVRYCFGKNGIDVFGSWVPTQLERGGLHSLHWISTIGVHCWVFRHEPVLIPNLAMFGTFVLPRFNRANNQLSRPHLPMTTWLGLVPISDICEERLIGVY